MPAPAQQPPSIGRSTLNALAGVGQGLAAIPDAATNAVGAVLGTLTDVIPGVPERISDELRTPATVGGAIERAVPTPSDAIGRGVRFVSNFAGGAASLPPRMAAGLATTVAGRAPLRLAPSANATRGVIDETAVGSRRARAEARRNARAELLGYRETPYWHGDRWVDPADPLPDQYLPPTHFSTRQEYADEFAQAGGRPAAREFRLQFNRPLNVDETYCARDVADVIGTLRRLGDARGARLIASNFDMTADEFLAFAARNPNAEAAQGRHLQLLVEKNTRLGPAQVLREAGFDAIVGGHEVKMLTDEGIRLVRARFDPSRRHSTHIRHALAPIGIGLGTYDSLDGEE